MKRSVLFLICDTSSHFPVGAEGNDGNLKTVFQLVTCRVQSRNPTAWPLFYACLHRQGLTNARGFPQFLQKGRSQYGGTTQFPSVLLIICMMNGNGMHCIKYKPCFFRFCVSPFFTIRTDSIIFAKYYQGHQIKEDETAVDLTSTCKIFPANAEVERLVTKGATITVEQSRP